jgi:hypothetical protein
MNIDRFSSPSLCGGWVRRAREEQPGSVLVYIGLKFYNSCHVIGLRTNNSHE